MASSALSRDSSTKSIRSLKKESTISIAHECTKAPVTRKTSWTLEMPGSKTIKKKRFFAKKNAVLILDSILHHKNYSLQYGSSSEQPLIKSSDTKKKVDLEKGLSIPSLKFSLSDSDIITMPEENNTTNDLPPVSHHEFGHNKSTDHFTQQFAPLPKHGSVKSKGESEGSFFSPKKTFKMAHASFRNRIHREMYGLETVFMTKKRTRDTKSSEFQGGDLNKYTSRTYAIQNGNEIFGDIYYYY